MGGQAYGADAVWASATRVYTAAPSRTRPWLEPTTRVAIFSPHADKTENSITVFRPEVQKIIGQPGSTSRIAPRAVKREVRGGVAFSIQSSLVCVIPKAFKHPRIDGSSRKAQ